MSLPVFASLRSRNRLCLAAVGSRCLRPHHRSEPTLHRVNTRDRPRRDASPTPGRGASLAARPTHRPDPRRPPDHSPRRREARRLPSPRRSFTRRRTRRSRPGRRGQRWRPLPRATPKTPPPPPDPVVSPTDTRLRRIRADEKPTADPSPIASSTPADAARVVGLGGRSRRRSARTGGRTSLPREPLDPAGRRRRRTVARRITTVTRCPRKDPARRAALARRCSTRRRIGRPLDYHPRKPIDSATCPTPRSPDSPPGRRRRITRGDPRRARGRTRP